MKARLKKTGEIVDIISVNRCEDNDVAYYVMKYRRKNGVIEECTNDIGDPEPYDVIDEDYTRWESRRWDLCSKMVADFFGEFHVTNHKTAESYISDIVYNVDCLIEELKKNK